MNNAAIAVAAVTFSTLCNACSVAPEALEDGEVSADADDDGIDLGEAEIVGTDVEPIASVEPRFECGSLYGCPYTTNCASQNATCLVVNCGRGSCPGCPSAFANVVIRGWCAYTCLSGANVTGIAAIAISQFRDIKVGPICNP